MENIAELAESVIKADRRALSQAITLIESSREDPVSYTHLRAHETDS